MRCRLRPERLLAALLLIAGIAVAAEDRLVAAAFSALQPGSPLPAVWSPLSASNIETPTRYTLVDDGGITVLRADSRAGASGLSRKLSVNPAQFPWLRWRWKIENLVAGANLRSKEGDDFPARLYVMFDYPLEKLPFLERNKLRLARALFDLDLPAATLCYVWDGTTAAGSIVPSAYTGRVKLVVVESGATRLKHWVDIERNIAADFRAAFGEAAPPVRAIAVATDTDNTGTSATAYFGDIFFYKQSIAKITAAGSGTP